MATSVFELEGHIGVDNSDAIDKLENTEKKVIHVGKSFLKGIASVAKWGKAIVSAVTTARDAVLKFASSAISKLENIDKMSQKIGLSTDAYQKWEYVLGKCGMQMDSMQNGIKAFALQIQGVVEGTTSSKEAFKKLGVSVYDAAGKMKSQEEILQEVILALSKMEEGVERAKLATTLFGCSGTELAPLFNQGNKAIEELLENTDKLGLIIKNDTVLAGAKLGDTFDDIKQSVSAITTHFKALLFPVLQQMADKFVEILPKIKGMFERIAPILSNLVDEMLEPTMGLVEGLLDTFIHFFEGLLPILTDFTNQLMPVFANLLANIAPILLQLVQSVLPLLAQTLERVLPLIVELVEHILPYVAILLEKLMPFIEVVINEFLPTLLDKFVELAPYFLKLIDVILPILIELVDALLPVLLPILKLLESLLDPLFAIIQVILPPLTFFMQMLGGILTTVVSPAIQLVTNLLNGPFGAALKGIGAIVQVVGNIFASTFGFIAKLWNKVVGGLKQIHIFGWKPFGGLIELPEVENAVPQIPMLAKSGILQKGQVGNLEGDGDVAVVPLAQNTAWVNKFATRLNALQAQEWRTRTERAESYTANTTVASMHNEQVLLAILDAVQKLDNNLQDKFFDAVASLKLQVNDREFARLVKKNV